MWIGVWRKGLASAPSIITCKYRKNVWYRDIAIVSCNKTHIAWLDNLMTALKILECSVSQGAAAVATMVNLLSFGVSRFT